MVVDSAGLVTRILTQTRDHVGMVATIPICPATAPIHSVDCMLEFGLRRRLRLEIAMVFIHLDETWSRGGSIAALNTQVRLNVEVSGSILGISFPPAHICIVAIRFERIGRGYAT